jgi:hypothetical protein
MLRRNSMRIIVVPCAIHLVLEGVRVVVGVCRCNWFVRSLAAGFFFLFLRNGASEVDRS